MARKPREGGMTAAICNTLDLTNLLDHVGCVGQRYHFCCRVQFIFSRKTGLSQQHQFV